MIYKNFAELIGKTPLVELSSYGKGLYGKIFAKAEFFNPTGSAKDRPALEMINDAEERGLLKKGFLIFCCCNRNNIRLHDRFHCIIFV